ncbi:MAG: YCF48-related protein, partial [Pseudomonadota bacterium]
AIDPNAPDTLFVVDNGSEVARSTDGGATWTTLTSPVPGFSGLFYLDVDNAQAGVVFARNSSKMFRSSDNGDTWTDVTVNGLTETPIDDLFQSPSDPSVFFATSWDGVHRSTDGGVTWTDRSANLPLTNNGYVFARTGVFDPNNPDVFTIDVSNQGIWRTTDAGVSWQPYGTPPTNDFFTKMIRDPSNPSRLYLASGNQDVLISTNDGLSWQEIPNDGLGDYTINDIALDPTDPTRLLIATATKGIFVSEDAALNWTNSSSGYVNANVNSIAVDGDNGRIYAGTGGGASMSSDGGVTWVDNGGNYDLASYAMEIDPLQPDTAYAGSSCCGLYKTTDAGDTWSRMNLNLPGVVASWVTDIDIPSTDPLHLLFTDYNRGLFQTLDGGTTWEQISTGLSTFFTGNVVLDSVDACDAQPDVIYAASPDFNNGGVFKSVDGGTSWERLSGDGQPGPSRTFSVAVHPENPDIVFAGSTGFYRSDDGGVTWELPSSRPPGSVEAIRIDADDPDLMYAISNGNLSRSVDGGLTWTATQVGLSTTAHKMAVDPNNRARVLMGFQNAGYREYTYATDLALIDDSGATTADAGQSVTLDATVQNIGPRSANRVVVTRSVPAGVTLESATAGVGSCSIEGQTASCSVGDLVDGTSTTMSITVSAASEGTYEIDGAVRAFEADIDAANASLLTALNVGSIVDSDGDGVGDDTDNCTLVANASQVDSNGDGYGNACDADFNNDCVVNVIDLGILRTVFFTTDPDADLNGDGIVNVIDLGVLRTLFFQPPGPAAAGSCPE